MFRLPRQDAPQGNVSVEQISEDRVRKESAFEREDEPVAGLYQQPPLDQVTDPGALAREQP